MSPNNLNYVVHQYAGMSYHENVMTGPSLSFLMLSILWELFCFVGRLSVLRLKITVKRPFFTNVAPYEVFALSLHASSAAVCRFAIAVVAIPAY